MAERMPVMLAEVHPQKTSYNTESLNPSELSKLVFFFCSCWTSSIRKIGVVRTNKRRSMLQSTKGSHRYQRCKSIQLWTFLPGGSMHELPGDKLPGLSRGRDKCIPVS